MGEEGRAVTDAGRGPRTTGAVETPWGYFEIVVGTGGVVSSGMRPEGPAGLPPEGGLLREALEEAAAYFDGRLRTFTVPLDPRGTPFQEAVWAALRGVPWGQTCTYGELARALGRPGAARAVGGALHRNPLLVLVPCHRVVGAGGSLGGFGSGLALKEGLLRLEGLRGGTR